jgi:multidrug resistance efflux pump
MSTLSRCLGVFDVAEEGHVEAGQVLFKEGHVETGKLLFKFDTSDHERDLYKLKSRLIHSDLAGDRLTDGFLNQFVWTPVQLEIDAAEAEVGTWVDALETAKDRAKVGAVPLSGGEGTPIHVAKDLAEARAKVALRTDNRLQKNIEVETEKYLWQAERKEILKQLNLTKEIIKLCTIRAPRSGIVRFCIYPGASVAKDDLLVTLI